MPSISRRFENKPEGCCKPSCSFHHTKPRDERRFTGAQSNARGNFANDNRRPCRFFNKIGGCKHGNNCSFPHIPRPACKWQPHCNNPRCSFNHDDTVNFPHANPTRKPPDMNSHSQNNLHQRQGPAPSLMRPSEMADQSSSADFHQSRNPGTRSWTNWNELENPSPRLEKYLDPLPNQFQPPHEHWNQRYEQVRQQQRNNQSQNRQHQSKWQPQPLMEQTPTFLMDPSPNSQQIYRRNHMDTTTQKYPVFPATQSQTPQYQYIRVMA